jgi:hypothetical protein
VIHVLRPYASEEEYLASERSSITAKTMLLIDQLRLPIDTAIIFDVSLTNGQKPIRAEGVVLGYAEPSGALSGGLRVRFTRYGAATKAFINRASAADSSALPAPTSAPAASSRPQAEAPVTQRAPRSDNETQAQPADRVPESAESSGVHRKAVLPVEPQLDREALLNRLRARRAD